MQKLREPQNKEFSFYAYPGIDFNASKKKTIINNPKSEFLIINAVCNFHNKEFEELTGKTNRPDVTLARYMCFFFLKKHTLLTLTQMGKLFGNKHHATVIYGIQLVNDRMDVEKDFKYKMNQLTEIVNKAIK